MVFLAFIYWGFAQASGSTFPAQFHWCAATAAYQIEGGNQKSDWWEWEQIPGHLKNEPKSGKACDSWNRYPQDVQALKSLHADTYRMSIEWSRLEPSEGVWDHEAVLHYRKEVQALLAAGITPLITLHHFTFPTWVRLKGGWEWSGLPRAFGDFADVVRLQISPEVKNYVTINEPFVNIISGYLVGVVPPGEKRGLQGLVSPLIGLLKAHAEVAKRYHAANLKVGMAHHLREILPATAWNPLDYLVTYAISNAWNWAIPEALESGVFKINVLGFIRASEEIPYLKNSQDFVGVNYYTRDRFSLTELIQAITGRAPLNGKMDPENWEYYPQGLESLLKEVSKRFEGKPIWITENGYEDAREGQSDSKRVKFLRDHLQSVLNAIQAGARVQGYCYWSLLDNFEWIYGFTPRFGLYETNYQTFERKPRASAQFFRDVATRNQL